MPLQMRCCYVSVALLAHSATSCSYLNFLWNWFIASLTLTHSSRPDRLRDIADRFNVDHEAVLDNVLYARAYTSKSPVQLHAWVMGRLRHRQLP